MQLAEGSSNVAYLCMRSEEIQADRQHKPFIFPYSPLLLDIQSHKPFISSACEVLVGWLLAAQLTASWMEMASLAVPGTPHPQVSLGLQTSVVPVARWPAGMNTSLGQLLCSWNPFPDCAQWGSRALSSLWGLLFELHSFAPRASERPLRKNECWCFLLCP